MGIFYPFYKIMNNIIDRTIKDKVKFLEWQKKRNDKKLFLEFDKQFKNKFTDATLFEDIKEFIFNILKNERV